MGVVRGAGMPPVLSWDRVSAIVVSDRFETPRMRVIMVQADEIVIAHVYPYARRPPKCYYDLS